MKVTAGTAVTGRGATASRPADPRRAAAAVAAKAAQAATVVKKVAVPPKPAAEKASAGPEVAAKPPAATRPAAAKPAATRPEVKQAAPEPAPATPPKPAAARPPAAEPAPAPGPAAGSVPQGAGRPTVPDRIPPRPPAKAETFVEGDHVVYPTHGVGKVERIATEEIAGHKLELIHITFEENRMTLRVPVAKARTAGLRKLATRKLFDEALAVLKGRARIKRTMWSRRAQEYEAKINSGDPLAIAEVVRDLHRNAGQPDQSFSERQIYEAAMDRLAAELAALDKTDKTTAATKLTNFLKTV